MELIYSSRKIADTFGLNLGRFNYLCELYKIKPVSRTRTNNYNILDLVPVKIGVPSEKWIFEPALDTDNDYGIYYGFSGDKQIKIDLIEMFNL